MLAVNSIKLHSALSGPDFHYEPFKTEISLHPCPLRTHTVVQCPSASVSVRVGSHDALHVRQVKCLET